MSMSMISAPCGDLTMLSGYKGWGLLDPGPLPPPVQHLQTPAGNRDHQHKLAIWGGSYWGGSGTLRTAGDRVGADPALATAWALWSVEDEWVRKLREWLGFHSLRADRRRGLVWLGL